MVPTKDVKDLPAIPIINFPAEVQEILSAADEQGNGLVEPNELLNILQQHKRLKDGAKYHALDLSGLPPHVRKVCQAFDTDGSGNVQISELAAAAKLYEDSKKKASRLMKVIIVGAFLLLLLLLCIMGLTFAVIELTKETEVADGAMTVKGSTDIVKVMSAEQYVQSPSNTLTAALKSKDGSDITVPAETFDLPLRYETPSQLYARMLKVTVTEPTFTSTATVTGVYKTADQLVVATDFFKLRMREDGLKVIEPLDDDLLDADEPLPAEQMRLRQLLGLRQGEGRRLLQASNTVAVKLSSELDTTDTETAAITWTLSTGKSCNGQEIAKLKDQTASGYEPGGAGIQSCKDRCAADPDCQGIEFVDGKCYWKDGIFAANMTSEAGTSCYTIDSRLFESTFSCGRDDDPSTDDPEDEPMTSVQIDNFLWSHNGILVSEGDKWDVINQGEVADVPACADICRPDKECSAFTFSLQSSQCYTHKLDVVRGIQNQDDGYKQQEDRRFISFARVCLNTPSEPLPRRHVIVNYKAKCTFGKNLFGSDLPNPREGPITTATECKQAVMHNLGTKCQGGPTLFGFGSGPSSTSPHPEKGEDSIVWCYCVMKRQTCDRKEWRKYGFNIYYLDAETTEEEKEYDDRLEKWIAEKGAHEFTPIPDDKRIELVSTGEVCMNVKVLRTREERSIVAPFITVDECMARALADPDCLPQGPTIQFHDYTPNYGKPQMKSQGVNTYSEIMDDDGKNLSFLDWDCSCAMTCELDEIYTYIVPTDKIKPVDWTYVGSTPWSHGNDMWVYAKKGNCRGEIRGINQPEEIAAGFPNVARSLPVQYYNQGQRFINGQRTKSWPVYGYPHDVANDWGKQNLQYEQGHCLSPKFRYTLDPEQDGAPHTPATTNIYTYNARADGNLCTTIHVGKTNRGTSDSSNTDYLLSWDIVEGFECPRKVTASNGDTFHTYELLAYDSNDREIKKLYVFRTAGGHTWDADLKVDCCLPSVESFEAPDTQDRVKVKLGFIASHEGSWIKYQELVPKGYLCPRTINRYNWIGDYTIDRRYITRQSEDGKLEVRLSRFPVCERPFTWLDMYLEFYCERGTVDDYQLVPIDNTPAVDSVQIEVKPITFGWSERTISLENQLPLLDCTDGLIKDSPTDWYFVTAQGATTDDQSGSNLAFKLTVVSPTEIKIQRDLFKYGKPDATWDFSFWITCKRKTSVEVVIGNSNDQKEGKYDMTVPPGYICPGTLTKYSWSGGQTYGDRFHAIQKWEGDPLTSTKKSTIEVLRADAPGAGWGMQLKMTCHAQLPSPKCMRLYVGPNPNEEKKTIDIPKGFVCPTVVNKENWIGGWAYDDSFSVFHKQRTDPSSGRILEGTTIEVARDGCGYNGWGMELQFDCCATEDVCSCTFPGAGNGPGDGDFKIPANKYVCNDGTTGICPGGQTCFAQHFRRGHLDEGCR